MSLRRRHHRDLPRALPTPPVSCHAGLKNVQGEFEYKVLKAYDVKQAMEAQNAIVLARRGATSPYIVPVEGAFMSKERKLFLQFPLYHGLDLLHWLKQERRPRYLRAVCSKVAQAVQFVHSQDVVSSRYQGMVFSSMSSHNITKHSFLLPSHLLAKHTHVF